MCRKHRHSCNTDAQRQQKTPKGTLHTYQLTRSYFTQWTNSVIHANIALSEAHLESPWRSASSARRFENLSAVQRTVVGTQVAPGWSSPNEGSQSTFEMRISPCTWSSREKLVKSHVKSKAKAFDEQRKWKLKQLTDSKAMDNQRTFPPWMPTAPCESWPGSRFGSGRERHSGWSRGNTDESFLPAECRRKLPLLARLT